MAKPYVEPEDYIPEDLRRKYKLGEYNDDVEQEEPEQEIADKDKDEEYVYVEGAIPVIKPLSEEEMEEIEKDHREKDNDAIEVL